MARVWAFSEAILPVLHHALARRGERLVTGQGLHDSRVIVAPPKKQASTGVIDLYAPLHVPANPYGLSLGIPNDDLLIQFSNEICLDREFGTVREAQGHLVDHLVIPTDQIRDAVFLLPDKLRCTDNPRGEFTGERAS